MVILFNPGKLMIALIMTLVLSTGFTIISTQLTFAGSFPGINGKIAYENMETQGFPDTIEIYVMNPDGTEQMQLTNNDVIDGAPDWSVDGKKIAFDRASESIFGNPTYDIWVMNADGTGQTQLTFEDDWITDPAWAPDGSKIAFERTPRAGGYKNIWIMNADGTGMTQLTSMSEYYDEEPEWSPDGSKIVFARESVHTLADIYVINVDGTGEMPLTTTQNEYETAPEWSPDGSRITYQRSVQSLSGNDIFVMNADGSGQTRLTFTDGDTHPAWSPDGTKITFQRSNGNDDIYVMNADGTEATRLTTSDGNDREPDWQPIPREMVGGVANPVNKLAIIAPYAVLAGLTIAVSTVYILRKRKD
ncbi:TolB family protein [Thermoproteota archaeon]